MPPISVIFPLNRNMEEKFAVLKGGPNYTHDNKYTTLERAKDDGAVVLAYGSVFSVVHLPLFCLSITTERLQVVSCSSCLETFIFVTPMESHTHGNMLDRL